MNLLESPHTDTISNKMYGRSCPVNAQSVGRASFSSRKLLLDVMTVMSVKVNCYLVGSLADEKELY
jgi:hypothetical protein